MEKIHGTSSHVGWNVGEKKLHFFAGGEKHDSFLALFNHDELQAKFIEMFPNQSVVVFGEAYGGKQQGMSHTYGKQLKFIGFDVKVGDNWLNVPNANDICNKLGLEFVAWSKIEVSLDNLTAIRDAPSIQAQRNGCGSDKKREGVVLRPLQEMRLNNGGRVICKYKPDENMETNTKREVSSEKLKVLNDAKAIAEEWVVPLRLEHVLQKFPADVNMESMGDIIKAMIEDVYREGSGEIVEDKAVEKAIGKVTVQLFKQKLQSKLQ